jgi:ferredoxin-like protein FixX
MDRLYKTKWKAGKLELHASTEEEAKKKAADYIAQRLVEVQPASAFPDIDGEISV